MISQKTNPIQAKTNPIQTQFVERPKLMQNVHIQRIMKKNAAMGHKKQTQNKPNQSQFRNSSRAVNGLKDYSIYMAGLMVRREKRQKQRLRERKKAVIHVSKNIP